MRRLGTLNFYGLSRVAGGRGSFPNELGLPVKNSKFSRNQVRSLIEVTHSCMEAGDGVTSVRLCVERDGPLLLPFQSLFRRKTGGKTPTCYLTWGNGNTFKPFIQTNNKGVVLDW